MNTEIRDKIEEILEDIMFRDEPTKVNMVDKILALFPACEKCEGEVNWISTDDKLPESGQEVLCFDRTWKRIVQNSWQQYADQNGRWFKESFSHWAVLPNKPIQNPIT